MGKIGEYEKTVVAEPLKEPFPAENLPQKVEEPSLPQPVKVSPED